ncbi:TatD family hydrolase [Salinicola avicenniae]|uniref:TatD family hydrolase n=1 Tax=Salinicola avicenniae TaxID=2916836 RepID=UPI002073547A|nr:MULTISPECIES: TatD family hydrolase [unclassified Salinicola]
MFVDSHCHLDRLDLKPYDGDLDRALDAARLRGVRRFLAIATSLESAPAVADIASRHADIAISVGLHPLHTADEEPTREAIRDCAEALGAVAIGETGLDFHYDSVPRAVQRQRFVAHLQAARQLELPVVIHTREARDETLDLIREHIDPAVGGVLHCFTEDLDMAREAVRHGFYISLSGIVTFASAESLREVARRVPLDRLLIETDSPFLAPVPHRSKPNEPQWVVEVAECIANERGITVDEVAMQTRANFYRLFSACVPSESDEPSLA